MLVDLHNHTAISSPCSVLQPEELIEGARRAGLDGICVTDHLFIAGADTAQAIGARLGFPVFRGIEARSTLGDVLVFGYYKDIPDGIGFDDLCWYVHEVGGLLFAAHPYHTTGGWNLYAAMRGRGLSLDADCANVPALNELDGIEVINGQVADNDNASASNLAVRLNVPGIGGSDAHSSAGIARAATRFPEPIRSDEELVAALRSRRFEAVRLRY